MKTDNRSTTLELQKGNLSFSAAHFTIFSETEREMLHGHDYHVYIALSYRLNEYGLNFDYRLYKAKSQKIIQQVDHRLLIAEYSKYLNIQEEGEYYQVIFNQDRMLFLKKEVVLLPLHNITLEELSQWFLTQFTKDTEQLETHQIDDVTIKIHTAPGQSASAFWERQKT